jgi:hypothetical protein
MELRALFEQGLAAQRAGRLGDAEKLYRQVLRACCERPSSRNAQRMLQ